MLYMKTRVTFRVAEDLAEELRLLPNQTHFVETALREALGKSCPTCRGTGRTAAGTVRVTSLRQAPALDRATAMQLQALVRLARRLGASDVDLASAGEGVRFTVQRGRDVLLRGNVANAATHLIAS
jgi:hypothetical protein